MVSHNLFSDLARTPEMHFRLLFYAAFLRVLNYAVQRFEAAGDASDAFAQFPFLGGYANELALYGLEGCGLHEVEATWRAELRGWESRPEGAPDLPLLRLKRAAELDDVTLLMWITCGLVEEDARFGAVFASLAYNAPSSSGQPSAYCVGAGMLKAWFAHERDWVGAHEAIAHLHRLGLLIPLNPHAPRTEWAFSVPAFVWDAATGRPVPDLKPWASYAPCSALPHLSDLVLPDEVRAMLQRASKLVADGQLRSLVMRGSHHNGRRTALAAVAHGLGKGSLMIHGLPDHDELCWRSLGPLATVLDAMPILTLELAPGESYALPALQGYDGVLGVAMGRYGGLTGVLAEGPAVLTLPMPDATARLHHWQAALQTDSSLMSEADLQMVAARVRMTGGNIHRAARLARVQAALHGQTRVQPIHIQQASRVLNHQALDTLAAFVPPLARAEGAAAWHELALSADVLEELRNLEARCRHREALPHLFAPSHRTNPTGQTSSSQMNAGVRALLSGPSGTGKTLAARALAAALNADLYRLDLSLVVNKYIGETEKNLNQILSRAEELDVILLLDEGDALLTQRTDISNANDRYANLETNFLLQRLETFEGILIVTTNASERIDGAFARRMDVVIHFRPPEADERRLIWQMHLPAASAIYKEGKDVLEEIAVRCALTGGQIRNAAMHASLLALNNGGVVKPINVLSAVQREYRKMGAACPLREAARGVRYG